jgi:hypothetical protein
MLHARRGLDASEQLTLLVEELLWALDDTARLAPDLCVDWRWQVQLDYLRDLQRLGRETLASAAVDEPPTKALPSATGLPARQCSGARACRAGAAWKFPSSVPRRGARRCGREWA